MKTVFRTAILFFALSVAFAIAAPAQTEREKGIEAYKKADYKNAVKALKKATKENGADFEGFYYLGLSYIKTGEAKEATKALKKSVELDKTNADAFTALSYSYLLQNDQTNAQDNAQTALKFNPKNADAHYIIGVIHLRTGSFSAAYERAKKALELNPELSAAYYLKTETLINSFGAQSGTIIKPPENRYELLTEAAESLEKFLSLSPNDKNAVFLREYFKSLQFFVDYYEKPENRRTVNLDADESQNKTVTPLTITYKPKPSYTKEAREAFITGNVKVLVVFGDDGRVKHTLVTKTLGYGLDEEAVKSAKSMKFTPKMENGKPVTAVRIVVFNFGIFLENRYVKLKSHGYFAFLVLA